MAGSRCNCNASSIPHRHTPTGIVDAPDGKGEQATASRYEESSSKVASKPVTGKPAAAAGAKKPIS